MADEAERFNRFFEIEESIVGIDTTFHSPKVQHLYDWWRRAGGDGLPSRQAFDILDHKDIVGNVFLTDVREDGRFVFRLLGETVIDMVGRNRTGEVVERAGQAEDGHSLDAYYRRIVETRTCWRCVGSLSLSDRGFRRFESIDCPLSSDGGDRVDLIIGVMDLVR